MSLKREPLELHFRPYRRSFRRPLRTARGEITERRGFLICLSDAHGNSGYGEIVTLDEVDAYRHDLCEELLHSLGPIPTAEEIKGVTLPSAAFGLSCACAMAAGKVPVQNSYPVSALLPDGQAAVAALQELILKGFSVFKWKIGIGAFKEEAAVLEQLVSYLPKGGALRLDANGSLNPDSAAQWLRMLDALQEGISFLEQPLPVGLESAMRALADTFTTPLALDESIRGLGQLKAIPDWPDIIALKPALAGAYDQIQQEVAYRRSDTVVFSTALETVVGVWGICLAAGKSSQPLGLAPFQSLFSDDLSPTLNEAQVSPAELFKQCEYAWNALA